MSNQPRPPDAALAQVLLTALTGRNVPRTGPLTFRAAHDLSPASCCYRELSLQQLGRRHCPRELSVVRLAPHDGVVVGRMPILTGRYLSRLLAGATDGMNNFVVMGYLACGMVASSFSIYSLMGNGKKLEG
jgi:hypothetical protein